MLGVDTTVALDGDSLAKPADAAEAGAMLRRLSGRTHTVYSGLCLRCSEAEHVRLAATDVTFRDLAEREIEWYLGEGEWRGRAGGYAVQGRGAALVTAIDGDYTERGGAAGGRAGRRVGRSRRTGRLLDSRCPDLAAIAAAFPKDVRSESSTH